MFWRKKTQKVCDEDTSAQFVRDIRAKIEGNQKTTSESSGIYVFEHHDDRALDIEEKEILENLRSAHSEWVERCERTPTKKNVDAFDTVRLRSLPSSLG